MHWSSCCDSYSLLSMRRVLRSSFSLLHLALTSSISLCPSKEGEYYRGKRRKSRWWEREEETTRKASIDLLSHASDSIALAKCISPSERLRRRVQFNVKCRSGKPLKGFADDKVLWSFVQVPRRAETAWKGRDDVIRRHLWISLALWIPCSSLLCRFLPLRFSSYSYTSPDGESNRNAHSNRVKWRVQTSSSLKISPFSCSDCCDGHFQDSRVKVGMW